MKYSIYSFAVLFLLAIISCKNTKSIPIEKIKNIKDPNEISFSIDKNRLKDFSPSKGLKWANKQAYTWDKSAQLILVAQRLCFESASGENGISVWLYIYRKANKKEWNNWLGITVGFNGIIDVGIMKCRHGNLSNMYPIAMWKLDPDNLELSCFNKTSMNTFWLMSNKQGKIIWTERICFENIPLMKLEVGDKIPEKERLCDLRENRRFYNYHNAITGAPEINPFKDNNGFKLFKCINIKKMIYD
jgi:hypothetical protein